MASISTALDKRVDSQSKVKVKAVALATEMKKVWKPLTVNLVLVINRETCVLSITCKKSSILKQF